MASRGDGTARPHGDGPSKRQKLDSVCQWQWMETHVCACCFGQKVSTWRGWDLEGKPHFYCYTCWDKFFANQVAARSSEIRDRLEGLGGRVAALSATLKGLDISGTGGSCSASRGSSSPVLPGGTVCTRHPATKSLPPIEEVSDLGPMTIVPSDGLRESMWAFLRDGLQESIERSRGGGAVG